MPPTEPTTPRAGPTIDMDAPRPPATESLTVRLRTPSRLRNLEFVLLLIAVAITGAAVTLVQLGALGELDPQVLLYSAGIGLLGFALHIVLRIVARDADPFILPIGMTLNGLGIAMIYRLDIAEGFAGWESAGIRQMVWTAIAMVTAVGVIALVRNHRVLARYRYVAMVVGIGLLLLPMLPGIGETINGGRACGFSSDRLSFQPGEDRQDRPRRVLRRVSRDGARVAVGSSGATILRGVRLPARARPRPDPPSSSGSPPWGARLFSVTWARPCSISACSLVG